MYTSINSLKIYSEVLGDGKPVLLLHGWGGSLESLKVLGERLKVKGFRVLMLDLPGFGKSDSPKQDLSLDSYAEIVERFLKQKKIDELCVFGHSFGGSVAVKLVLRKNVKVNKLILCNSSGIRGGRTQNLKLKTEVIDFIKGIFSLPGLKSIYPPLRKIFYYYVLKNRDYIDYQEIAGTFRKVIDEDLTPQIEKINIPVLLIWGAKDKDTPIEHARIFKSKIKDCRLKIFEGEGHGFPKFKPGLVSEEIATFVRDKSKRT